MFVGGGIKESIFAKFILASKALSKLLIKVGVVDKG